MVVGHKVILSQHYQIAKKPNKRPRCHIGTILAVFCSWYTVVMKQIIGLVGEKLAGKDTIANYMVEKHGADHVRFTHVLDEVLNALNLPVSRRNEIDLGLGLRKIFGDGVLGRAIINRVQKSDKDLVVVNGIRMDEMQDIKNLGAVIIYVTAPAEARFERYKNRHEKSDDGVMDFEQFKEHLAHVSECREQMMNQSWHTVREGIGHTENRDLSHR
jgi:dephospho-CoA kinase